MIEVPLAELQRLRGRSGLLDRRRKRWLGRRGQEGRGYGLTGMYNNGPIGLALTTQSYYTNATGSKATTSGIAGS